MATYVFGQPLEVMAKWIVIIGVRCLMYHDIMYISGVSSICGWGVLLRMRNNTKSKATPHTVQGRTAVHSSPVRVVARQYVATSNLLSYS